MVKVLVFGATGVIGKEVARSFAHRGHTVYGLTRSEAKAKELQKEEIIGVVGDITNISTWTPLLKTVSVVVDASADYSDPVKVTTNLLGAFEQAAKSYPDRKFTFVYTSGVWVHGTGLGKIVDENDVPEPIPLVAWRPAIEQQVIKSNIFNGVVLRPGLVIGKSGSICATWFAAVEKGEVTLFNDDGTRASPVHVDDLADTYVAAVERIEETKGQIFNVVNSQTENVTEIIRAAARVANKDVKIVYRKPLNGFEEALGMHCKTFDNRKAVTVLGFAQRHPGLVDGMERYYKSWQANK